ncbi:MAG: YlbF family regulator [Lachnospiraceae bacterium]|nr:YlbF family regulator [Lachnospiraceae bacterium]
MNTVDEAVNNLIKEIKNSEVYLEYRKQLELLKQDPELKRQVDEFRKRNYEMQMSEDMDFGMLTRFQSEFKTFRENPLVDNFLAAELDFCRMMQKINFNITEAIDFE